MGSRRRDREILEPRKLHDAAPKPHELLANLLRRAAHRRSNFDNGLMKLRLHLAEESMVVLEELRDVRLELSSLWVDDLVLFLDANREGRRLHGRHSLEMIIRIIEVSQGRSAPSTRRPPSRSAARRSRVGSGSLPCTHRSSRTAPCRACDPR